MRLNIPLHKGGEKGKTNCFAIQFMERSENSRRSHFTTSLLVNSLSNLIRRYATPYPYQGKANKDGRNYIEHLIRRYATPSSSEGKANKDGELYNNPSVTLTRAVSLYTRKAKKERKKERK